MFPNLSKTAFVAALIATPIGLAVAAAPFPGILAPALDAAPEDLSLTETYCDLRATLGDSLRQGFAEEPRLVALTGTGMTMELWTSDVMGTWTVVHHGEDGISCIVTSGQDWSSDADAVVLLDGVLETEVHQS